MHSRYKILSPDGTLLHEIRNDPGNKIGGPTQVPLAAGSYTVVARANGYRTVEVPVVIAGDKTTVLHLEGGGSWPNREEMIQTGAVRVHRRFGMGETILAPVPHWGIQAQGHSRLTCPQSQRKLAIVNPMGLDGVELVMAVEENFAIVIEDADAEKMRTPRDLIAHIVSKVGCVDRTHCATQRAFNKLRLALMRHCGLNRTQIRPQAPMIGLLPFKKRREILRQILDETGIAADTEMIRPKWLVALIIIFSLVAAAATAAQVLGQSTQDRSAEFVLFFMTFGAVAILCGGVAAYLTRGLRYQFKPAFASVGGFSRWMVVTNPETFGGPTGEWTREQVAEKVRLICIEQLGLSPGTYREDADFIKDFGMG